MTHSLNFRLLAAFALVIVVIMTTVFFFVYRTTRAEISDIARSVEDAQDRRLQLELSRYYMMTGSPEGLQTLAEQWGNLYGRRILITDSQDTVIADSASTLIDQTYRPDTPGRPIGSIMMGNRPSATLYILPSETTDITLASLQITYRTIGRFFVWGGLIAVALALLLTFLISRRILAPVKALTAATRRFGQGDFTHRVAFQDESEVGELAQSFNTMADDLERNENLRRSMVADIAHELRTPLSNLRGYLEAISDGVIQPDRATVDSLTEEAGALSRLIDDLQELSLADAGELHLNIEPGDISNIIQTVVTSLRAKAVAKDIVLEVEVAPDVPRVEMDSHRIEQVLRNLLENAVAHTGPEGKITARARREGAKVLVSVTDNGEGIPAEDQPMIFERFYRVDKSRTRATGGTGLGLTIAKRLVEANGGTIEVTSRPGEGSTFTFSLNVAA